MSVMQLPEKHDHGGVSKERRRPMTMLSEDDVIVSTMFLSIPRLYSVERIFENGVPAIFSQGTEMSHL